METDHDRGSPFPCRCRASGVGDWKAGGDAAVPWREMHAGFDNGKWRVQSELPKDWPREVQSQAKASSIVAYGDRSHGQWFFYYQNDKFNPAAATSLYLVNEKGEHATRSGGPVKLP